MSLSEEYTRQDRDKRDANELRQLKAQHQLDQVRAQGQQEGAVGLAKRIQEYEAQKAAMQSMADLAQSRFTPEGQTGPVGGYVSPTYTTPSNEAQMRADDSMASLAEYAKGMK